MSIFNDPRVLPEPNRNIVIVDAEGDFIAPVQYCQKHKTGHQEVVHCYTDATIFFVYKQGE